jgi:ArsR family transcriptional regulator, arsenate/arsenite/antimonite-responsive transcriptional repressor
MNKVEVIAALAALAHEHRLDIFRVLVEEGPSGLAAGEIAEHIGLVPSSLTFHLQHLTRAGLIVQRRDGRQLIYSANFPVMSALVGFLTDNCCGGAEACAPGCAAPAVATRAKKAKKSAQRARA